MLLLMLVLGTVAVSSIMGQRNIALTGAQIRELELGQNPALLALAAMTRESVIVIVDSPEVLAAAQEDVNLNINCLPWLQRFPGAALRWYFQQFDEFFMNPQNEAELIPPGDMRREIGGTFNEWLNITGTLVVPSAEAASTGRYSCEACYFLGTPREECHRANVSLQIIGGPPFLDKVEPDADPITENDDMIVYTIGADFCIPADFEGSVIVQCTILNLAYPNPLNISRAFPSPDRAWFQENDLLYIEPSTESDIMLDMEFFMASAARMLLGRDVLIPSVLTALSTGDNIGGLEFDFTVMNATSVFGLMGPEVDMALRTLRNQARNAVVGTWTCEANNTFGSDTASSTIRICGDAPNLPGCPAGQNIIFAQEREVVPAGCTVCVPEGTLVTLDCTGQSMTPVQYEWRNSMGMLVSNMPRFSTTRADNYTCTATNVDNPSETAVTILAYSTRFTFTSQITEELGTAPRPDNGCSRLSDQSGLEGIDGCVFVDETLDLRCFADDNTPLVITAPDGTQTTGTLRVPNFASNGTYTCTLTAVEGPCGGATRQLSFAVFDPATIDRSDQGPTCNFVAGVPTDVVMHPSSTPFTLCCPTNGIEDPVTAWYRIVVDPNNGCASEVLQQDGVTMDGNTLRLTSTLNSTGVTYVCRTSNRAGSDADIVSLRPTTAPSFWDVGDFGPCSIRCRDGVRTRTVVCRSTIDNMVLPDTDCSGLGPRPNTTQSCADVYPDVCLLDPVWISGEWTQCSSQCGGWRFRSVICQVVMTGEIRPNFECNGQVRPASYDTTQCQRDCCVEDRSPLYCRSLGAGYCADEAFSKSCCWTCGRKTIGRFG